LEDTNVRRSGSGDAERIALDCPLLRAFASRQNDFVFPGSKQGWSLSDMSLLMLLRPGHYDAPLPVEFQGLGRGNDECKQLRVRGGVGPRCRR